MLWEPVGALCLGARLAGEPRLQARQQLALQQRPKTSGCTAELTCVATLLVPRRERPMSRVGTLDYMAPEARPRGREER